MVVRYIIIRIDLEEMPGFVALNEKVPDREVAKEFETESEAVQFIFQKLGEGLYRIDKIYIKA